jgi:uncharacterized protein (TIGR02147 family)
MNIYNCLNYKEYLLEVIHREPNQGRGFRKKLAEAAKCQLAYISHVLNGNYDFSLEHAEAIAMMLGLSESELEYFLLLVEYSRAGTQRLKSFFKRQILKRQEAQNNLKNRVKIESTLAIEDQAIYYSSWTYSAIHIALTIPVLQTQAALAQRFHLDLKEVKRVLEFLVQKGLAVGSSGNYSPVGSFLHLERDSPMIISHHTQWRQLALQNISIRKEDSLHYSSCFSVAVSDIPKLKNLFSKFLEDATLVIKPSQEEKLLALGLDLFEV